VSGPVQTVYVSNGRGSTVTPIDTATNTPGPPVPIGRGPGLLAMAPDGRTVYVANIGSGTVTPIDTATNTPGEPVEVGVRPRAIVITPDSKTAYVVNQSRAQPPPWHNYEAEKRGLPQPAPDPRGTDRHSHEHAGKAD